MEEDKKKVARPVGASDTGEGWPYAPENWPNPGDNWRWKVGTRKGPTGFWVDRYLYPPERLQKALGRRMHFASKVAVKEYVQKEFPKANVDAFFESFFWRIPHSKHTAYLMNGGRKSMDMHPLQLEASEHAGSELTFGDMDCKAGNKMCSLQVQESSNSLDAMTCNICCIESGFCRDCCCILCCKTIDWKYGGYSFIKCEARVNENYICGHIAHVNCALRSYMAGTVGGSIGLDVEYCCRRCDKKTDLIPHVSRLLETCQSVDSRDDIEKILNLGFCILRGSQQTSAKNLMDHIQLILTKLKSGICITNIWKVDEDIQMVSTEGWTSHLENSTVVPGSLDIFSNQDALDLTAGLEPSHEFDEQRGREAQTSIYISSENHISSSKFENEINQALESLRKSQDLEYRIAEQKLYGQKDLLLGLHQQLDTERSELAEHTTSPTGSDPHTPLSKVSSRVDQIMKEVIKLQEMIEIAKGFGRTPKAILKEHYGLQIED